MDSVAAFVSSLLCYVEQSMGGLGFAEPTCSPHEMQQTWLLEWDIYVRLLCETIRGRRGAKEDLLEFLSKWDSFLTFAWSVSCYAVDFIPYPPEPYQSDWYWNLNTFHLALSRFIQQRRDEEKKIHAGHRSRQAERTDS